jgi:putative nucleotidyltransferase with HDIG domain
VPVSIDKAFSTDNELLAKIPSFPPVALKLQGTIANPNVDVNQLVELLRSDPVLSAELLRVANSPMFGFSSSVDSLHNAVVLLGLNRVQTIAVTISLANYARASFKSEELHRCWKHTLACAVIAGELAKHFSISQDRGYTAGLLHDIGRLGLLVVRPVQYAHLLRDANRSQVALLDLEQKLFGIDHCEAGAWLVEKWGLPAEFRVVAGRHHDAQPDGERDLLPLVHWACRIADELGFYAAKPFHENQWEELRAQMPFQPAPDPEVLRRLVESRLQAHQPEERYAALADGEEAEPGGAARPAGQSAPPASYGGSRERDILLMAVTTALLSAAGLWLYYFTR